VRVEVREEGERSEEKERERREEVSFGF